MIDWVSVKLEIDGEIITIAGVPYKIKFYDKKASSDLENDLRAEFIKK